MVYRDPDVVYCGYQYKGCFTLLFPTIDYPRPASKEVVCYMQIHFSYKVFSKTYIHHSIINVMTRWRLTKIKWVSTKRLRKLLLTKNKMVRYKANG